MEGPPDSESRGDESGMSQSGKGWKSPGDFNRGKAISRLTDTESLGSKTATTKRGEIL